MSKKVDNFIKSELERIKSGSVKKTVRRVERKVEIGHELGKYIR